MSLRWIATVVAVTLGAAWVTTTAPASTPVERRPDVSLHAAAHPPGALGDPAAMDPARLDAMLDNIDMTLGLIDAYGECREAGRSHQDCMTLIRATLDHARQLIGR